MNKKHHPSVINAGKSLLTKHISSRIVLMLMAAWLINGKTYGQSTNPAVSTIPYSFTTYTGTAFPASLSVGLATTNTLSTSDFTSNAPNGTGTGQWDDEVANGISFQGSGTNRSGCFKVRMNTTGISNINVAWTGRRIAQGGSFSSSYMELQWRSGNSGSWNNVSNDQFDSDNSSTGFDVVLPSGANNLADLQIRWIIYDQQNFGNTRDRVGVDDIMICVLPSITAGSNSPVCPGAALNLSATGSTGTFAWAGPNSFTSSSQNPTIASATTVMAGTYTVTVTIGGCSNSSTTTVSVVGVSASATSNSPLCSGSTINLSTTSVTGATYSWSGPNGFTSTSRQPSISNATTLNAGIYSVTVTLSGCTATSSATVAVNTTPTISASNNGPVCAGSTLNLTATSNGGTFAWSGPNSYSSTSQNPSRTNATVSMTGTYTVTVTNSGCTATSSTAVTVNAAPVGNATSSASSICEGLPVTLTSNAVNELGTPFTNTNDFAIPDNNLTGVQSPITVSGLSPATLGSLTLESIKFNITHSYDRDLRISLKSPQGTVIDLVRHRGSSGNNFTNTTLVSSGGSSGNVSSGSAPFTGTYNSETPFSALNGEGVNGNWNLAVRDTQSGDSGTILDWTLTLKSNTGISYVWSSTPSGATGSSYTLIKTPSQTTTYHVVATGSNGCSTTSNVSVNVIAAPQVSSAYNAPLCAGNDINFSSDNNAPGQSSGNLYSWTGPNSYTSSQQNPILNASTTGMNGNYTVVVTNQFLCTASSVVSVGVNPLPDLTIVSSTNVTCNGFNNGLVQLSASMGTAPYDFTDFVTNNNDGLFSSIAPGTYVYYVADANGCSDFVSLDITEPATLLSTASDNSPLCQGSTLNFNGNVNGGTLPYSFNWQGQNGFSSTLATPSVLNATVINAGNYTLDLIDANGCTVAQQTMTVNVDLPATVSAGSDQSLCAPSSFSMNGAFGGSAVSATWTTSGDGTFDNIHSQNAVYTPGVNDQQNVMATLTFTTDNPNSCGSVSQSIAVKAHAGVPVLPSAANNATSVCPPVTALSLGVLSSVDVDSYNWAQGPTTTGVSFNSGTVGTSVNVNIAPSGNSTYSLRVTPVNACGSGVYKTIQLRRSVSAPANPAGSNTACANDTKAYTVPAVTGAETYTWTAPSGSLINGNATPFTTSLTTVDVTFPPSFTSGQVGVTANVACFTSSLKTLTVSNSTVALSPINGVSSVCPGSSYTFTVPAVSGAVTYQWSLPTGITGTSSSNIINVNVTNAFVSGAIGVKAFSNCGVPSALKTKSVVRGTPPVPSLINGPTNGLCAQTVVYTCPSQPGVNYNWTVPSGATVNSGNGTSSIETAYGTFTTGPLCVTASNGCGSSASRCVTVKGAPNTPAAITVTPATWCANEAGIQFDGNVSNVSGSYQLQWSYPGSSVADYIAGGGNSSSIMFDWKSGNGTLILTAYNGCGSGSRTFNTGNENCRISKPSNEVNYGLEVAPNPSSNYINISTYHSKNELIEYALLDLTGRTIVTSNNQANAGNVNLQMDLTRFAKGTYTLVVKIDNTRLTKKVVLQ